MSSSRFDWLRRVKSVEREHLATRFAVDHLLEEVHVDSGAIPAGLRVRELYGASDNLEATYVIRMFAEFESGLRSVWTSARRKESPTRTRDLVDGIGAFCRIPDDCIAQAHAVREYRNSLVHGGESPPTVLIVSQARRHLCLLMSFLPLRW